jgi:hypothetical protein
MHTAPPAQSLQTGNMFTHHQKTVILDAPMPGSAAADSTGGAAAAAAAAAPATLDTLGTPQGSPHAGGAHQQHVHKHFGRRHKHGADGAGDGGGPAEQRRVIAFVGGLDLCDGRYDTPDHPLFDTIGPDGVHCDDFHQACVDSACRGACV